MFYDSGDTFAGNFEGWGRYNTKAILLDEAGTTWDDRQVHLTSQEIEQEVSACLVTIFVQLLKHTMKDIVCQIPAMPCS